MLYVDLVGPDRSGLLTLDGSSIRTDPDGSRRIVWMINRMIKRLGKYLAADAEAVGRRLTTWLQSG